MKDINLMLEEDRLGPSPKAEAKSSNGAGVKVLIWVLASVIVACLTIVTPGIIVKIMHTQAETLKNELTEKKYQDVINLKNQISQVDAAISSKQQILQQIDKENRSVSPYINNISHAAPKGCYITSFSFNGQSISITGIALGGSKQAAEFMANLDRLNSISGNSSNSITMSKAEAGYTFQFTYNLGGKGAN